MGGIKSGEELLLNYQLSEPYPGLRLDKKALRKRLVRARGREILGAKPRIRLGRRRTGRKELALEAEKGRVVTLHVPFQHSMNT